MFVISWIHLLVLFITLTCLGSTLLLLLYHHLSLPTIAYHLSFLAICPQLMLLHLFHGILPMHDFLSGNDVIVIVRHGIKKGLHFDSLLRLRTLDADELIL